MQPQKKKSPFPEAWQEMLSPELQNSYMKDLLLFIKSEKDKKIKIAPKNIFHALELVKPEDVKVVILGQDPYPTEGNANGLAFAVSEGTSRPQSLKNIFKELAKDLNIEEPEDNTLLGWASQGVLLLNTVLTVRVGEPFSHRNKGWELFTDRILKNLSNQDKGIVFILWGGPAQSKRSIINTKNKPHKVLLAAHPSPLSAYRGFFGSKPFSKANELLKAMGRGEIDWSKTGEDKND
mgnify:CR=1 FL=1